MADLWEHDDGDGGRALVAPAFDRAPAEMVTRLGLGGALALVVIERDAAGRLETAAGVFLTRDAAVTLVSALSRWLDEHPPGL